jgi:molybdenum-dependent DNA-binding transcriptional regulator ModE
MLSARTMTLDAAVRRAIANTPGSIRELAKDAGVSHVFLWAIVHERQRATPRVARLVAAALERRGKRCVVEAARVRAALQGR